MASHPANARGFTLVEMIVALALLALISVAGLAMVDSVLATRARTEKRLDRLADLQRAMQIMDADLTQLSPGPVTYGIGGFGFTRAVNSATGVEQVNYAFHDAMIERVIDGRSQKLLGGVAGLRFAFYDPAGGWRPSWPPNPKLQDTWPAAIAIEAALLPQPNMPTGTIRRVVQLPEKP